MEILKTQKRKKNPKIWENQKKKKDKKEIYIPIYPLLFHQYIEVNISISGLKLCLKSYPIRHQTTSFE